MAWNWKPAIKSITNEPLWWNDERPSVDTLSWKEKVCICSRYCGTPQHAVTALSTTASNLRKKALSLIKAWLYISRRIFDKVIARWTFWVQQFFFLATTISRVAIIKTKGATIVFFSSPPFLLLALSFSSFLFFVTVILEVFRLKKPAFWRLFHWNDFTFR